MKKTLRLSQAVITSSVFVGSLAFADTTIKAPVAGPILTSVAGNIVIDQPGQINGAANGINIDTSPAAIVTVANNTNANNAAIYVSGFGINITTATASITNNTGTAIISTASNAIEVAGDTAVITNNYIIKGAVSGIHLASGTDPNITNAGGTIQGGTAASILVDNGSSALVFNNMLNGSTAGTVQAINAQNAIELNGAFTSINNGTGSNITAVNGSGIFISPNSDTDGIINNNGTISISNTGSGSALNLAGGTKAYTGIINNYANAFINNAGTGNALLINTSFGAINNAGTIQSTSATATPVSIAGGATAGTLNNSGTIAATVAGVDAIFFATTLGTGITGINNSGTISAANAANATINATANSVIVQPNGIVNTGTICDGKGVGAAVAIDLSGANNVIPLYQQAGKIIGAVNLMGGASTVAAPALTMTGGTITGGVTTSANTSILNISGGSITGTVNLATTANTFNQSGGTLQAITSAGSNTFNVSGGSFTSLTGGANDILNVTATYTNKGPINNVPTVNTTTSGTVFTVDSPITGVSTKLNINPNTTIIADEGSITGTGLANVQDGGTLAIANGSSVSMGTASNLGTIAIANNASFNTTGVYNQTGDFITLIQDMTPVTGHGQINSGGVATFNAGSTISPVLGSGSFILNNFPIPVVTSAGVVGFNNITVDNPPSAVLSFTKNLNGNTVELISHTNPFALVAEPDIPLAIAATLDGLVPQTAAQVAALDPDILILLGQLQLAPDVATLSDELLQLSPSFNNALPTSSRIAMDNAFDSIHARLEGMSRIGLIQQEAINKTNRDYELYNGVNYGDANVIGLSGRFGVWIRGDLTTIDQHKRHEIEGFRADSTGFALGFDWIANDFATVGISETLTKVDTKDATSQQNTLKDYSYQTTIYANFVPYELCQANSTQTVYIETMAAIASHKYQTARNIVIGNLVDQAVAKFYGFHYGVQGDVGYAFISADNYLVAPFARFRYTYLDVDSYAETNAGGLSLLVQHDPIQEMVGGLGVRLAIKRDFIQAIYVPEFSFALLYDFAGQAESMQANFLGGGSPFYVDGIKPAQYIQQYGAGITAYTSDGYSFTVKGNFEHRNELFGYNVYLQLRYAWD